jgi:hypothetical protein
LKWPPVKADDLTHFSHLLDFFHGNIQIGIQCPNSPDIHQLELDPSNPLRSEPYFTYILKIRQMAKAQNKLYFHYFFNLLKVLEFSSNGATFKQSHPTPNLFSLIFPKLFFCFQICLKKTEK